MWFSILQTLILIVAGTWQLRHLKAFFKKKKLPVAANLKCSDLRAELDRLRGREVHRLTEDVLALREAAAAGADGAASGVPAGLPL
mgnify:CR=1 FL=1